MLQAPDRLAAPSGRTAAAFRNKRLSWLGGMEWKEFPASVSEYLHHAVCLSADFHPLLPQNIRTRTLQGVGFNLSFGRLPGSLCYKYMLVDGDKVVFGSYR